MPGRERVHALVAKHVSGMKLDSVAGPDALPVAFVKCARVRVSEKRFEHVLLPLLTDIDT